MTNKWISEANACDPRLHRNASAINYAVKRVNIEFLKTIGRILYFEHRICLHLIVPPTFSSV